MFIISGPGGVGKDTIVARLLATDPHLWLSRSWTTRARRPSDVADSYVFVSPEAFMRRAGEGGFWEWAEYLGHLYGTPIPTPPPGCDVVLVIEVQGAHQVLERDPRAVMILVVPPSIETQRARLDERGDPASEVARRLAAGREEVEIGRRMAQHVVVNDDLDRAVSEVAGIVERYRRSTRGA